MRYRQAMDNALDVMTFLAYSAALGLLIGVLLGVFALLLAAPAQAAGPAVGPLAGSLLLHRPPGEEASPAVLLSTETVFRSEGPIQRVRVVQAFRNPFRERQEGVYVLRLPEEATLERLAVRVRQDAESDDVEESSEAEAIPSHALISGTEGAGVVTHAIAGIEPGETVLVELEYQQVVRYDRGKTGLRLLTRASFAAISSRRRRAAPSQREGSAPLGVEGAWLASAPERWSNTGAQWLWLLPVVALYVLVAFFS
jgi:Ca-activated chloride channel family protein